MRRIQKAWGSSGLSRFESEVLESGPSGLESPQINRKEPGTSDHSFLSGGSSRGRSAAKNMWKLLKTAPGRIPCFEAPDCFY